MVLLAMSELDTLRAYAASTMDMSCQISTPTSTRDSIGSQSTTYGSSTTVQALLIGPSAPTLQSINEEIGAIAQWRVLFPYGTSAPSGSRLVVGGHTLTVQVEETPNSYDIVASVSATEEK